jgi:hypothetical protein
VAAISRSAETVSRVCDCLGACPRGQVLPCNAGKAPASTLTAHAVSFHSALPFPVARISRQSFTKAFDLLRQDCTRTERCHKKSAVSRETKSRKMVPNNCGQVRRAEVGHLHLLIGLGFFCSSAGHCLPPATAAGSAISEEALANSLVEKPEEWVTFRLSGSFVLEYLIVTKL